MVWLGYYSRARNLHRAAKNILATKKFPDTLPELMELLALVVLQQAPFSHGFNKQATILDGNVKRVLTRFFAIQTWPGKQKLLVSFGNMPKR